MTDNRAASSAGLPLLFKNALVPIPEVMEKTCTEEWMQLGEPGTWLTGAERTALAREVRRARDCKLCAARKQAVSPYAVVGTHDATPELSAPAVDAVHRIASDPGRLGSRWHQEVLDAGISDAQLVETVGVIALVEIVDAIAEGTGAGQPSLPEPREGAPSRRLPEGGTTESARVPTIRPDKATGEVADYYASIGGMSANIRKALTLVPAEARRFARLHDAVYVPGDARFMDMTFRTALSRPQMELIAATVSSANECFY